MPLTLPSLDVPLLDGQTERNSWLDNRPERPGFGMLCRPPRTFYPHRAQGAGSSPRFDSPRESLPAAPSKALSRARRRTRPRFRSGRARMPNGAGGPTSPERPVTRRSSPPRAPRPRPRPRDLGGLGPRRRNTPRRIGFGVDVSSAPAGGHPGPSQRAPESLRFRVAQTGPPPSCRRHWYRS